MSKLIYGVGVNDAGYPVNPRVNGKRVMCSYYKKWHSMLSRCYSLKHQDRFPSYRGCTVCADWLIFSNFRAWMKKQSWHGLHLDKDIITPGNKIYSSDACCFIPHDLNMLLTNHAAKRGANPQGVSFHKIKGKYRSDVKVKGRSRFLGYFSTPDKASISYVKAKIELILLAASDQSDRGIASGLRLHAELLKSK